MAGAVEVELPVVLIPLVGERRLPLVGRTRPWVFGEAGGIKSGREKGGLHLALHRNLDIHPLHTLHEVIRLLCKAQRWNDAADAIRAAHSRRVQA